MVVISPPESEGEADEVPGSDEDDDDDDDQDEQRREAPITPRSRFLNRKRILTSDSEADETTLSAKVRSPRKKLRVKPEALSEIKVERGEDVVVSPASSRNLKKSHSMKGKGNAKALEVNGHTNKPTSKTWYIDLRERRPGSTSRDHDHRRGSQYSSPSKSHRSE